jgi:hypothetical protein
MERVCNGVPVLCAPDGLSVVGTIVVGANVGVDVVGANVGVAAAHTIRIGFAVAPALAGPYGEVSRVPLPVVPLPFGTPTWVLLEYSLVPTRTARGCSRTLGYPYSTPQDP